jgi:hypothetical protein
MYEATDYRGRGAEDGGSRMRFPESDIISLVEAPGDAPRYELAESIGPDLRLAALLQAPGAGGLEALSLGYGSAAGDARLRQAIADLHGVSADDVVLTVGGMHALFLVAFILCGKDDEAVTTSSGFPLARNALEVVVGENLRTVSIAFDRGYQLDTDEFRAALSPRTRLVSLASPQNPSGIAFAEPVLRDVVAAMEAKCPRAYLLLDETYREAAYGADPVAPSGIGLGPRVISVASLSKCHGAPGLRLGWAITRDMALRRQLVVGKFSTVISCSPVDEALALSVLAQRDAIIAARRTHLAEGLAQVARWVERNHDLIEWVRPDAGAICCIRLKPIFADDGVWRFYSALADAGVRVGNGGWFGEEARVFRLGFGLMAPPDLEAALELTTLALARTTQPAIAPVS